MKATYILSSLIVLEQGFITGQSGRSDPAHVIKQMPQHVCKGLQRNPPGGRAESELHRLEACFSCLSHSESITEEESSSGRTEAAFV